jgi:type 1 glutamine amidotransferase
MRYLATAIVAVCALALVQCNDGSSGIIRPGSGGTSGTGNEGGTGGTGSAGTGVAGTGTAGTEQTPGTAGAAGSVSMGSAGTSGVAGSLETGGTTGSAGAAGDAGATGAAGSAGVGGTTGAAGTAGAAGTTGAAGAGMRQGPFKIIVLTTALDFTHDSIQTCATMLQALGQANAPERAKIAGLAADSTWTVDQIANDPDKANYFSEVTADNLKRYELFYSNNPTGTVFTSAPSGAQKKQIFVEYWNNGGSWAGQHSATDFEKNNSWSWFQDNIDGGWFVDHDPPLTPGTVTWQPDYVNHPILKGLPSPWNTSEEWYLMNRNVEAIAGFRVLGKVSVSASSKGTSPRPAVWIRENTNGKGGRSFYTIKGHSQSAYAEPQFRELMLRGILWSVHRLPGGN